MARLWGWLRRVAGSLIGGGPSRIEPCPLCGRDVVTAPTSWSLNPGTALSGQRPKRQVVRACAVDGVPPYNDASRALAAGADPTELLGHWRT
jgi:hypothetical protein